MSVRMLPVPYVPWTVRGHKDITLYYVPRPVRTVRCPDVPYVPEQTNFWDIGNIWTSHCMNGFPRDIEDIRTSPCTNGFLGT